MGDTRKQCKTCKAEVLPGTTHTCSQDNNRTFSYDDDCFLMSMIIGAATDSALLGGLLGGDIVGGIVGDMLDGDLFD